MSSKPWQVSTIDNYDKSGYFKQGSLEAYFTPLIDCSAFTDFLLLKS